MLTEPGALYSRVVPVSDPDPVGISWVAFERKLYGEFRTAVLSKDVREAASVRRQATG